jgi:hypothetical protein
VRTADLSGHHGTRAFTDEVIRRTRTVGPGFALTRVAAAGAWLIPGTSVPPNPPLVREDKALRAFPDPFHWSASRTMPSRLP